MKFVRIKQCKFENASRENRTLIILIKWIFRKIKPVFFPKLHEKKKVKYFHTINQR